MKKLCLLLTILLPLTVEQYVCNTYESLTVKKLAIITILELVARWDGTKADELGHSHDHTHGPDEMHGHTNDTNPSPLNNCQMFSHSCKEIKARNPASRDGIYSFITENGMVYQTFCDMTTNGGGWTLVASVHENNIAGKCTLGDRWSSQKVNNSKNPDGNCNWVNYATFGAPEGATSDAYKNPGYFDIHAKNLSVWHVPNETPLHGWRNASILRYHTETGFLALECGNLMNLYKKYLLKYNGGSCPKDNGPAIPVVYDCGNTESTTKLYPPNVKEEAIGGFVGFHVFSHEKAAFALCSGFKATGCHTEHKLVAENHQARLFIKRCFELQDGVLVDVNIIFWGMINFRKMPKNRPTLKTQGMKYEEFLTFITKSGSTNGTEVTQKPRSDVCAADDDCDLRKG
ncbi:intelectin-1b-like [Lissotriton helveticus]